MIAWQNFGHRAVLAQFLGHHVEAVEDAAVAPVQLRQGGGEGLLDRVAADPDHLLEEAVEEDRVADLVDLLGGEEVGHLLGRGGGDVGGEGVGDPVLAVIEHRVDPHRRAPLDVAQRLPAGAVLGEVEVVGAPVALLPAVVEVLVGDVVHQALGSDAHRVSFWCRGRAPGDYRDPGRLARIATGPRVVARAPPLILLFDEFADLFVDGFVGRQGGVRDARGFVLVAPLRATLESGLMISSHGDHQVP